MPFSGFDQPQHGGQIGDPVGLDPSQYYALSPGGRFPGDIWAYLEGLAAMDPAPGRDDPYAPNPDYNVPNALERLPGPLGRAISAFLRQHEASVRRGGGDASSINNPLEAGYPYQGWSGPGAQYGPLGGDLHGLLDMGNVNLGDFDFSGGGGGDVAPEKPRKGKGGGGGASFGPLNFQPYAGVQHTPQFVDWQPKQPHHVDNTPTRFVSGNRAGAAPPGGPSVPVPAVPGGAGPRGKPGAKYGGYTEAQLLANPRLVETLGAAGLRRWNARGGAGASAGGGRGGGGGGGGRGGGSGAGGGQGSATLPPQQGSGPGSPLTPQDIMALLAASGGNLGRFSELLAQRGTGAAGGGGRFNPIPPQDLRGYDVGYLDRGTPGWVRDPTQGIMNTAGMPLGTAPARRPGETTDEYITRLHDSGRDMESIIGMLNGWGSGGVVRDERHGYGFGNLMGTGPENYKPPMGGFDFTKPEAGSGNAATREGAGNYQDGSQPSGMYRIGPDGQPVLVGGAPNPWGAGDWGAGATPGGGFGGGGFGGFGSGGGTGGGGADIGAAMEEFFSTANQGGMLR